MWHFAYELITFLMQSRTPHNILLVDDDVDHLCICSRILQSQHFSVRILPGCNKMEDLMDAVRDFRPEVIFMDHHMPGVDGAEATRMLKSNPSFKSIPIIYFSGQDDVVRLAAAAGADDVLRKNFYVPKLLELARKYTT